MFHRLPYITLLLLLFGLNPIYSQYDFNVDRIPDSLIQKANSVIRHSKTKIELDQEQLVYTYDYAITALNKKHENKLFFAEHYRKGESKVKDVEISIYDSQGDFVKKIKKKEIKEYGLQDIEFADDMRSMIYMHSAPVFPVTIHVTYTHVVESPFYVPTWFLIQDFRQSVEQSSIEIIDRVGDGFNFKQVGLGEADEKSERKLFYERQQLKVLTKEKYMPNRVECFPRLEIALKRLKYFDHEGVVNNWSEFGAWTYKEMFLPKQDVDLATLKNETSSYIDENDSPLAIARKLYQYMQDQTRYILISLEDGGWSPLPISVVHDRKYGDCKALSFYYNTLCKAHGIDATLVLVNAGNNKRSAQPDFYSSTQFNHVISKLDIEGETYWVDCTSKINPFNFLGDFTDDRNVLLFNDKEGEIIRTPEYRCNQETLSELTLSENGNVDATIKMKLEGIGIGDKLYQMDNMSAQERKAYQKSLVSKYEVPQINEYHHTFDSTLLAFHEEISISCKDEVEHLGNHLKLKVNRGELEIPKIKRDKNRVWPIQFLRNKIFTSTTVIKHDLSLVPKIDDDVIMDSEFGTYAYSTSTSAGQITIKREFQLHKGMYKPDRYKEIKSFFDKLKKIEKRSIVLSAKS